MFIGSPYFSNKCLPASCASEKPVYQAIWANNKDFYEVLISPTMVQDHMPDKVLDALEKVRHTGDTNLLHRR